MNTLFIYRTGCYCWTRCLSTEPVVLVKHVVFKLSYNFLLSIVVAAYNEYSNSNSNVTPSALSLHSTPAYTPISRPFTQHLRDIFSEHWVLCHRWFIQGFNGTVGNPFLNWRSLEITLTKSTKQYNVHCIVYSFIHEPNLF